METYDNKWMHNISRTRIDMRYNDTINYITFFDNFR
jgi:hypothetical protein